MAAPPDSPPRLARRLLAAILPANVAGRSTLGDLIEEYHRRPRGLWRRVWFWAITVELVARYLPGRVAELAGGLGRDLAYATRLTRRYPVLALAAVTSLGLAIGVGTAGFTIVNGTYVRWRLADDPSVTATWRRHKNGASKAWPAAELYALREQAQLQTIEAWTTKTLPVGRSGDSATQESVGVQFVTGTYLTTFRAGPAAGRLLQPDDDRPGAPPVAVLDHLFWRRHFDGDRSVLGRTIAIDKGVFTVVGIADRDYVDPARNQAAVWVPLAALDLLGPTGSAQLFMTSRIRPAVAPTQADAELTALLPRLGVVPSVPPATMSESSPVTSEAQAADNARILGGVVAAIALVLVLACANVSNLQLAGAATRRQEIAIRLSCGASRRRIIRQLVTESVLLSGVAGSMGFVASHWLSTLIAAGMGMSRADLDPDARVYVFVAMATVLCAVGTGLVPALHAARHEISSGLKDTTRDTGSRRRSRTTSVFIGIQAAASLVLIAVAALLVRTLVHLAWLDPGYDVNHLLTVSASFPRPRSPDVAARATEFWRLALGRVRHMPGVQHVSLGYPTPFAATADADRLFQGAADADYFETAGLRLVRGRSFTADEVTSRAPVMVISERVAREYWGQDDPLGASASRIDKSAAVEQVIGVVADSMFLRVHDRRTPAVFRPTSPDSAQWVSMAVRTSDPVAMAAPIRDALRALSAEVRPNVLVVKDRFAREFERPRRYAALGGAVAVLALGLSVVGLFGVTSFSVRARTREIGIRMALGGDRGGVVGLLVRDGMRAVVVGLAAGLVAALLAGRFVAGMLYGLSDRDPLALGAAVVILLAAALAAVIIPTRRAARLDPAVVLRDV